MIVESSQSLPQSAASIALLAAVTASLRGRTSNPADAELRFAHLVHHSALQQLFHWRAGSP